MKKRMFSLMMSVFLIFTMLPQCIFAQDSSLTTNFEVIADALVKGDASSTNFGVSTDTALAQNVMYTTSGSGSKRYMYYAFDISGFDVPEGHAITSAKLKLSLSSSGNNADAKMAFWYVDTSAAMWKEDVITFGTQPLTVATEGEDYMIKLPVNPDAIIDYDTSDSLFDQKEYTTTHPTSFAVYEFDIVSIVRDYINSVNPNHFSFAMAPISPSGNFFTYNVTKERYDTISETASGAVKTTLEITTEPLEKLKVISSSPSNGATDILADEDIILDFNNPLDESKLSEFKVSVVHDNGVINVSNDNMYVNDTRLIISENLSEYTYYTVNVSGVKDVYGQALGSDYSFSFETGSETKADTTLIPVVGNIAIDYVSSWSPARYRLNLSSKDSEPSDTPETLSVGSSLYLLVKLDISKLDSSKLLRDIKFSYTKSATGATKIDIYTVPNGTWLKASDFEGSSNSANTADFEQQQALIKTYYDSVVASIASSQPISTYTFGSSAETHTIDITSVVNSACRSNEDYVTLCLRGSSTRKLDTINGTNPPVVSALQEDISFAVSSSYPSKHGFMDGVSDAIEMNLATNLDEESAKQNVELQTSDGTPVDATVSASGNKLTITAKADLNPFATHRVVFKSGLTDAFLNTVSGDTIALVFTSGSPLEVSPIKLTDVSDAGYSEAVSVDSFSAGDEITAVTEVLNVSSGTHNAFFMLGVYDIQTHKCLNSKISAFEISNGDEPNKVSASIVTSASSDTAYLKAFIWDSLSAIRPLCLATSLPESEDANFANDEEVINVKTNVFENSVSAFAKFPSSTDSEVSVQIIPSDFDISSLSGLPVAQAVEKADENVAYFNQISSDSEGDVCITGQLLNKTDTYTIRMLADNHIGSAYEKELDFVSFSDAEDAWNNLVSDPESNLETVITAIGVSDNLVLSMKSDSDLFDKIADYEPIGEFNRENADSLMAKIKSDCEDIALLRIILSKIASVENISQVYDIVTNPNSARVLGIEDLVESYEALSKTTVADKAVAGKEFLTAEDFAKAFADGIEEAQYEASKPVKKPQSSGGSSGGGSSSIGATVAAPTIPQTPTAAQKAGFTDIASVPWATEAIESLYASGIISGRTTTTFAPNENILREEFVKLVVSLMGADISSTDTSFTDADSNGWYVPYLSAAAKAGLIKGREDGSFGVGEYITRQDACVILSRIVSDQAIAQAVSFTDYEEISPYARDAAQKLSSLKIINGSDGKFMPLANATRAETACMIYRLANMIKGGLR